VKEGGAGRVRRMVARSSGMRKISCGGGGVVAAVCESIDDGMARASLSEGYGCWKGLWCRRRFACGDRELVEGGPKIKEGCDAALILSTVFDMESKKFASVAADAWFARVSLVEW